MCEARCGTRIQGRGVSTLEAFPCRQSALHRLSGYNEIARSDRMFIDAWHIEPAVGAVIMRRLLGLPECDCADAMVVWNSALPMNARDAEAMLALQEQRMAAATAEPNVYSTTVAAPPQILAASKYAALISNRNPGHRSASARARSRATNPRSKTGTPPNCSQFKSFVPCARGGPAEPCKFSCTILKSHLSVRTIRTPDAPSPLKPSDRPAVARAPTVRSASLVERRGLEPPVLFGLFHLGKKGRSQAAFGPNLLADRSEKQFSDRL